MINFEVEQKTVKVGSTCIGGKMGEYPTVLIGSIFQKRHYIVKDAEKGIFDIKKAKELLKIEEECSLATGNPRILDVVADTKEAMIRYIDFIIENTDIPFLVDSPLAKVRIEGMKFCSEQNVMYKAVYNTIEPHSTEEELNKIAELGVKNAVIMGCGSQYIRPLDRISLLCGSNGKKGLIQSALDAGIQNILIDAGVVDLPSNSWTAKAIQEIKNTTGYPAGCAPSNALYTWLRDRKISSPQIEACGGSVFSLPLFAGSNFIFYGPIQNARWVFPAVAVTDAMLAYGAKLNRVKPKSMEHPLFKIFQKN